jgi:transposase
VTSGRRCSTTSPAASIPATLRLFLPRSIPRRCHGGRTAAARDRAQRLAENRKRRFPFDAERDKWRNLIARTNCRIKDFRAIATSYDKLARDFLAGLRLLTAP